MPYLATAFLILISLLLPAGAFAQAGVSYQVPGDNPYVGVAGAAPEVYAIGLRNPYRFSFDRSTDALLIGDVGQGAREEIDWITSAAAKGANFGWACREGTIAGPRAGDPNYPCPITGPVEPLFDYVNSGGGTAVTGGFVVHDLSLAGLVGRYLYVDFYAGDVRSLQLDPNDPKYDHNRTEALRRSGSGWSPTRPGRWDRPGWPMQTSCGWWSATSTPRADCSAERSSSTSRTAQPTMPWRRPQPGSWSRSTTST